MRRVSWQPIAAAALLMLLAVLATLQYRWLGEVGDAERERMRSGLRSRAQEFAQEFDGELSRAYLAFHVDGDQLDADAASALSDAYARWQSSAAVPALVRDVYLAEGRDAASTALRRLDPGTRTLATVAWPADLSASFARRHAAMPQVIDLPRAAATTLFADAIDARTPALIIAVPHLVRTDEGGRVRFTADAAAGARAVIVRLDSDRLQHGLLEPLLVKFFGDPAQSEYVVTIARRPGAGDDQSDRAAGAADGTIVYNSAASPVDASKADVTAGLFELRADELNRLMGAGLRLPPLVSSRVSIAIVRKADGGEGAGTVLVAPAERGAWQLRLQHRTGSLDTLVAQSRRRNLAISLGVLGLLAASFVLVVAAAQRQQRLSRQQMEFVAAVSHELRTPLAVICSAAENLADGVVAGDAPVKQYGTLIETEGRRLGDMVERVLAFAGLSSGVPIRARAGVDLLTVIADAVAGVQHEARDRGVTIAVNAAPALPPVTGDADALRSAVQNIVGNAVKYSAAGGRVEVTAAVSGPTIEIRVADRGLGIDANDLPHIFKPFYRGGRAADAQVRGSGVGLSVVRHVVDAHRGSIRVESRVGEGTTVIVGLPVRA